MKACYLDANVLVNYSDNGSPFHTQAVRIVETLIARRCILVITSLTLDEYEYAILRSSEGAKQKIIKDIGRELKKLFTLPTIRLINPPLSLKKHLRVLRFMEKYNLRPRDAYHLLIMKTNKIGYFATFDSDFDEVFEAGAMFRYELLDP